jgi:hypothetical protein
LGRSPTDVDPLTEKTGQRSNLGKPKVWQQAPQYFQQLFDLPEGETQAKAGNAVSAEDTARADLARAIEAAKRQLEIELAALRRGDPANQNIGALERGEAKLRQLDGLLDRLTKAPGAMLADLRTEIGGAVAASSGIAAQAGAAASFTSSYTMAQLTITHAEYLRATAALDRKMAQSYAAEAPHLAYAHETARRYGIDITPFTQERKTLESERDDAHKKGDKLAERTADALIAHNTYNTLAAELDHIKEPDARGKHIEQMRAQQRIIDERSAARAAQAELDARRAATEKNLAPEEAKSFIERFTKERLDQYQNSVGRLHGTAKANEIRRRLSPRDLSANERDDETFKSIADLAPNVQADIQRAVSAIRKTEEATDAEMELSAKPARHTAAQEPSQIKAARVPEQHEKVETPKTPMAKNDTGKAASIA